MRERLDKSTVVSKCVPIEQTDFAAWHLLGTPTRLCPIQRGEASYQPWFGC